MPAGRPAEDILARRSSIEIRKEIEKAFGFFPPFFEPALDVPSVLENLWQQTLTAYLENPIPALFKEKLAAYLARFCTVPYCLPCHSSALRPLGMKSSDVLALLQAPPIDSSALAEKTKAIPSKRLSEWPNAGSPEDDGLLYCCVAIFLNQHTEECQRKLRDCLPPDLYAYLNLFLAYNRTCLSWAEAHPELNFQSDKRVQDHYADLVADDPDLVQFFDNYNERFAEQGARRERRLTDENKSLFGELKLNQEWFAATLRGIGDAVIATDVSDQPTITFLNGVAEELKGWTNDEAKGLPVTTVFNIINESTRKEAFNPIAKVIATGKVQGLANHTVLIRKDGHEFVIEDSAAPIKNSSGLIEGVVLVFRDVTEKKELERAAEVANEGVKAAKQNLEAFFMQAPTPMVILEGAEHRFTIVNPPYERLVGQKRLAGRTVRNVFSAGEAEAFVPLLDGVMKTGLPFIGKGLPFDAKDESGNPKQIWIDLGYHAFRDDTGNIKGVLAIVHDVTDQVEARKKLEDSETKYRTLFESVDQGFCILEMIYDENGRAVDYRFIEVNPMFESQTGLKNAKGRTAKELIPELDEFWFETYGQVAATGETIRFEQYASALSRSFNVFAFRIGGKESKKLGLLFSDVTESRRAEAALKVAKTAADNERAELVDTLESMSDAFFSINKDWIITRVNGQHEKLVQKSRDEQVGRNFIEVWFNDPKYEDSLYLKSYRKVMAERVPVTFEDYYDPLKFWTEVRVYPKSDGGIAVFFTDITERKKTDQALTVERQKLAALVSESSSAIGLMRGPDLVFEVANKKWTELVSPRAYIGRKYVDIYPELVGTAAHKSLVEIFDTGVPFIAEEMKLTVTSPAGILEEQYFDYTNVLIHDADGKPYGVYCNALNVTDRVVARKKVEESEVQLRVALSAGRMGTWLIDLKKNLIWASEEMQKIFGVSSREGDLLEQINLLIHPEDANESTQALLKAIKNKELYKHEYRIVLPRNAGIKWILSQGEAQYDKDGTPLEIGGVVVDITERKNAELAVYAAKEEAERANETKTSFLANMSHEIRTPLGAIIGFSEMLRDESVDREERRSFVDIISKNAKSLTRVIDDILDLSKVEAGKLEIELSPTSIRDILHDVTGLFTERAKSIGISLTVDIPENIPEKILTDAARIRQILINIVGNAVKFTERGSVTVSVQRTDAGDVTEQFKIAVKDTGRGLTPEQREKLFRPFSQADNTTTREFGGTGLGLVLSRRLAVALGGTVEIEECEFGKGCTFAIFFAARILSQSSPKPVPKEKASFSDENVLKGVRILLVEDSPDNQMLINRVLIRNGAFVTIVDNGSEGVNRALETDFDIVLMDIQMHIMDGYTAMRKLREAKYSRPVVALTAHAMEEERIRTRSAGFIAHVSKPIEFPILIQCIVDNLPAGSKNRDT